MARLLLARVRATENRPPSWRRDGVRIWHITTVPQWLRRPRKGQILGVPDGLDSHIVQRGFLHLADCSSVCPLSGFLRDTHKKPPWHDVNHSQKCRSPSKHLRQFSCPQPIFRKVLSEALRAGSPARLTLFSRERLFFALSHVSRVLLVQKNPAFRGLWLFLAPGRSFFSAQLIRPRFSRAIRLA